MVFHYKSITISGKIAVGTTTLSANLQKIIGWKHINAGFFQREYDRQHNIHENKQGASSRSDDHEKKIDDMTKRILKEEKDIIYEAWLSGFMAQGIDKVLKVLVVCSDDKLRIDRVVNRDKVGIEEAKTWIKTRETENITKWKKIYGNCDFWNPRYYNLIIDTYSNGPLEAVDIVLDRLIDI